MSKGLHIKRKNEYIENYLQNKGELQLLGKGDGAEVLIQKVSANETVFIEAAEYSEVMEFYYILEGEVEFVDSDVHLGPGDYFYCHYLKEPVEVRSLSDSKWLYFTTNPVFQDLSSSIKELVELSKLVEEKDSYTHSHTQSVKDYALKIGNNLRLSKEKIENIAFAAILHDIGKIDIPDEIIKKPGKLTDEEFDIIKQHPIIGAEIVKKTYYENLSEIILQHHERINGTGYPYGLKGDEIIIEAQVVAMADTFHAMASDRPYRKAMDIKDIVEEIRGLSGVHFDKKLVDALIEILEEENEI